MMDWARKPWWVRDRKARQKQDLFDEGEEEEVVERQAHRGPRDPGSAGDRWWKGWVIEGRKRRGPGIVGGKKKTWLMNEWNGRLTQASVGAFWPEASINVYGGAAAVRRARARAAEPCGRETAWEIERKTEQKTKNSRAMMRVERLLGAQAPSR